MYEIAKKILAIRHIYLLIEYINWAQNRPVFFNVLKLTLSFDILYVKCSSFPPGLWYTPYHLPSPPPSPSEINVFCVYLPAKRVFLDFSFCAMKIMIVFSFFNSKNIILNMFSQTAYCLHVPPGEFDLPRENHYARNLVQVKFWK